MKIGAVYVLLLSLGIPVSPGQNRGWRSVQCLFQYNNLVTKGKLVLVCVHAFSFLTACFDISFTLVLLIVLMNI